MIVRCCGGGLNEGFGFGFDVCDVVSWCVGVVCEMRDECGVRDEL